MVDAENITGLGVTLLSAHAAVPTIFKLAMPDSVVGWDRQQEDQADEAALRYMLDRKYDPREVPKFYAMSALEAERHLNAAAGLRSHSPRLARVTDTPESQCHV